MDVVIQYKCPNCGGDLKFEPASEKYCCEYCRGIFSQSDLDKMTQSKMEQTGQKTGSASDLDETEKEASFEEARVYNCPSCGAQIVTESTTVASMCYYCHNPVILSRRLEGAYKPDYVLPFKITREQAVEIFEKWIQNKKYLPKAFYDKSQIEKMAGVYFPYLIYSCNIAGKISGEATKVTVTRSGDVEITDTGRYYVERDGNMEVKYIMRNALNKANKVLAESVLPFNHKGIVPFNMSYLSGFVAEKRDIDKSEFEQEVDSEVKEYAVERLRSSCSGYTGLTITENNTKLLNPKWQYVLMPVWTMTYKDRGKIYYFSINGQSGKTVGELPVDRNKLIMKFVMTMLPILVVFLAVFWFFI